MARKDRPSVGKCDSCDKPLYDGPLGPEHARYSDDRDHSPQLVAQRPMSLTKARAVAKDPESFNHMLARVDRVRDRMEARAGEQQILLVTHYGWMHFFLGLTLFRDAFGPEHLQPLWLAGHANTGVSIFERRRRVMDGMDFSGWGLTTWNDQAHL